MSLFSSLNVGARGLAASQIAIDVTGQNISNANTEGYSRKRVELAPDSRRDGAYGEMGMGVDVTSVQRIRDIFIDQQTVEQIGDRGKAGVLDEALEKLEGLFAEPGETGFNQHLNSFWDAWQDLANNPADLSARGAVRTSGEVVVDLFHSIDVELRNYRNTRLEALSDKVRLLNGLTQDIFRLNNEIAAAEAGGGRLRANDTRDQRDLLVRRLAELVDVKHFEDPHGRITVTTAGSILVGPSEAVPLEVHTSSKMQGDGTPGPPTTTLRFANSRKAFMPKGGELRGILEVWSTVVPKYQAHLDAMAGTLVSAVNGLHETGYNLNRKTGVYFFDPARTNAQEIDLSASVKEDVNNISAAPGGTASAPVTFTPAGGIPASANPVMRLQNVNPLYRDLVPGSIRLELASGAVLEEGAGRDYVVDYVSGTITFVNYARYAAGDAVEVTLSYRENGYPGNGDGGLALEIAQLRHEATMKPDQNGNHTQSMDEYYSAFVGELGIERLEAKSNYDTKQFLIAQLEDRQAEVSGVSLDEEMTNMIKFEHSYQASARYISVVDDMLDVLMNI